MMTLDDIRDRIMEARRNEAAAKPFPSGVAPGDDRTGFLNASEAGRCTRWLWYDKHGVAGETHHPYGVFDRGHAFELWLTTYLAAGRSTPAPSKSGWCYLTSVLRARPMV